MSPCIYKSLLACAFCATLPLHSSALFFADQDRAVKRTKIERRPRPPWATGPPPGLEPGDDPHWPELVHTLTTRQELQYVRHWSDTPVWWLHIPKTGTSFITSVLAASWSEHRAGSQHQVMDDAKFDVDYTEVVAIFREPAQRLASSYQHLVLDGNCCGGVDYRGWGWEDDAAHDKVVEELHRVETPAESEYLQSFQGCSTNMILGYGCFSRHQNSAEDIQEAQDRVQKFYFVGLQSEWLLSVCLYNYLITGKRFVEQFQLANNRPTNTSTKTHSHYDTTGYKPDEADDKLYANISSRFHADLDKNGINEKSCGVRNTVGYVEI